MEFDNHYPVVTLHDAWLLDIIRPDLNSSPWIAGGSVLCWIQERSVYNHDVDIFFKHQEQFNETFLRLTSKQFHVTYETNNAITLKNLEREPVQVQLIKTYFDSLDTLFKHFDFTVCRLATDGNTVVCSEDFMTDYPNKTLNVSNNLRPDCYKRLVKYMLYGYEPSRELLERFYNTQQLTHQFTGMEDYDFTI